MSGTVYLAGPLFSAAEQEFNRRLRDELEKKGWNVLLPQERCAELVPDMQAIYRRCIEDICASHAVVAVLDGSHADDGTSFECGYAKGIGKTVIGVRTDFRLCETSGTHVNAMLQYGCEEVIIPKEQGELLPIVKEIAERVCAALKPKRDPMVCLEREPCPER